MTPLNDVSGQNPRQIAAEVLLQRRPGGDFTEGLLERALAQAGLSTVDRALCQELVYGVVRWQAALDWLIGRKTDGREQKPGLQNLLRLGLYQIFWLDRIPDHAAVHETVKLVRQSGFDSQTGFVNAVLRGYLRAAGETQKLLSGLKLSQPPIGWSHPEWLVVRWQKRWGVERAAQLMEWNNTPPKTFARVNTLINGEGRRVGVPNQTEKSGTATHRPSPDEFITALLDRWRSEGVEYDSVRRESLEDNLVFELKSHPSLTSLGSFQQGWFYIQDPSTLFAPLLLGAQPGETILDFCAAPGGKTTFLAQLMNDQGRIVAQDISGERLKLIKENCARLGVTCVEPVLFSAFSLQPSAFDRILVDAPCSNTGVMRRRVDSRWRIQPEEILRLQQTQLALLERAVTRLKPGGVLVYSTCSLEPEENQEVVNRFLYKHTKFKLESERELLPFVDNIDGAFVARLNHLP
jgi:16S rRNA (cytosine967-C5)-methyltransferase